MSSGVKGGAASSIRVSIPNSVKKTIENIKEITGQNHSEDEIYAMLKECSMDPNETAQKLLLLDTFHEVKRKRDKRKENLNKEPTESKWKPPAQARVNRAGRGNYPSRYTSHDAGGGRNLAAAKGNAPSPILEKGASKTPLATAQETKKSSAAALSNGPSATTSQPTNAIYENLASATGGANQSNATSNPCMSKSETPLPLSTPVDSNTNLNAVSTRDIQLHPMLDLSNTAKSIPSAPASVSCFSSSDPVLLPSQELPLHAVGTIRREVGTQHTPVEQIDKPTDSKSSSAKKSESEVGSSNLQQKMADEFQGVEKNRHLEPVQPASSTIGVSTASRPSSNYNNRTQVIGSQKVGSGKEWKPKSTNSSAAQGAASSGVSIVFVGNHPESQPTPVVLTSRDDTLELQRKLENSQISHRQHVIIPNHLHVPEAEKLGFCFGSFDASFGVDMSHIGVHEGDKSPPLSESSEAIDEPVKELQLSNQNALVAAEDSEIKYPDQVQSPLQGPENLAYTEVGASSSITPDYSESMQEVASGIHQHPVVHTSSNYNFGFMPPHQLTPLESSELQACDAPQLPGFVVQQSFDPASYYAQFYRPGIGSDGRLSPFHSAGAANKYNGIAALVSPQSSQSPQELQGGVPMVLSTASPTPLVTQAAGVMQSSIPTQQPLPVFRHPTGVHSPHYPPNYFPYGPYFSPFYPPPAIHQFLSNGTFPQQPQAGNLYPTPPGATAKYSVSQYKQGSNTGNSTHVGMPGSYAPYGLSMANYTPNPATAAVTSTSSEDVAPPQVKENNIHLNGPQSEGSGVWITNPGRDISTMQASSFCNLSQGQLGFTPTQPGHGTFTGIFHHAQVATVHPLLQQSQAITSPADMVGQTTNMYQQPQHSQINWPSNY
ncbi:hypothetical protein ACJIZ3_007522 [Penstemon smallii]|uniref:GBF-interacting protein 1 N-terminal domain-containing protein n=1 Tax=Penstemon smallii TaxID=265156 RepID=A0ABD3SB94_9LAMI